jgi:hypothetical protein
MNLHPLSENFGHLAIGPENSQESICVMSIANEQTDANARLIAAAPELLAACLMLIDDPGITEWANEVLKSAVKKARGEQ